MTGDGEAGSAEIHEGTPVKPAGDEVEPFELHWLPRPWTDSPVPVPVEGDGSAAGCSSYDAAAGELIEVDGAGGGDP